MGILELIVVLVTIAGLFVWNRAEGRADARHMDVKLDSMRSLIDAIREQTQGIQMEMKDFHARLLEIEKKRQ